MWKRGVSCVPIPLRIVKSPILYLTFVENVIGSRRDDNVLPFKQEKTALFKMNSTPLLLTNVIARRGVLLTSSVSMVELQFSEVGLQQGFSKF